MNITQTVDIPVNHRLTIEVPQELPAGRTILTFTPVPVGISSQNTLYTSAEALQMAEELAVNPKRKPISRHFGKHKGIFGINGVAYQRSIRDEWD